MFVIIGLVVVFGSILGGYTMHLGKITILIQLSEFMIIRGAGLGSTVIGNPPALIKRVFANIFGLLKSNPSNEKALKVLHTGAGEDHHLAEILDLDLERQHDEAMEVPAALNKVGDAMPGFGSSRRKPPRAPSFVRYFEVNRRQSCEVRTRHPRHRLILIEP